MKSHFLKNKVKDISKYMREKKRLIDHHLGKFLPRSSTYPRVIHQAMHYSVFSGGKRLRPILTIAAAETHTRDIKAVLPAACAIELVHTFSLIHDDLPALDNDDFRRGKPTCHRMFGEDMAILAGDALLILAFELLGESERIGRHFLKPGVLIKEMTNAIGTGGMIGGQVVDLLSQKREINVRELKYTHENKTAALITAALRIGGIIGGMPPRELTALTNFGRSMGFCFQIVDDLLDEKVDRQEASYLSLLGRERAMEMVEELMIEAEKSLKCLGDKGDTLRAINRAMASRMK